MRVSIGSQLGQFEVLSIIGAGGMGEVYRARDSKLGREVALKVLPEVFARDEGFMARFGREATLLASLNHPNIAAIHSLEDSRGVRALVMELVEGPTLEDRIEHGPIPVDEALRIARQVAEALEYAHDHGIVHRDLKPANVKVTADDAVKVLDFGLAKSVEDRPGPTEASPFRDLGRRVESPNPPEPSSADHAGSPVPTELATRHGTLLGTSAYMSPEQAKGKPVDRRADIWAFGCLLYEMLAGRRPFRGETATSTRAAVVDQDPDWSVLPAATPPRIRALLKRCLQKDAKKRLQAIGEARIAIDDVLSGPVESAAPAEEVGASATRWKLRIALGLATALALAALALAALYLRQNPRPLEVVRYEIPPPPGAAFRGWLGGFAGNFSVSPDGRSIAFMATGSDGTSHLWVRSFDALDSRVLDGTDGAIGWPIWSTDSRSIAFGARGKLRRIDAAGGPPQVICDAPLILGGAWTQDGEIVFGSGSGGVFQVAAGGGVPDPITGYDAGYEGVPQGFVSLLPDGRHFVYGHEADPRGRGGIYIASVDKKPEEQTLKKLLPDVSRVVYAPPPDGSNAVGHLLFVRTLTPDYAVGTLMAQPFDAKRMELAGNAVPIAEQVLKTGFSASSTGVLAFVSGDEVIASMRGVMQGRLTWHDRKGNELATVDEPGLYRTLALSPGGERVAFERAEPRTQNWDIWVYDTARGASSRFTFDPVWDSNPVWSPDGSRIAFASNRGGFFNLYSKAANLATEEELMFASSENKVPSSWSPDGRSILYYNNVSPRNIWLLAMGDGRTERQPIPLVGSRFDDVAARFSPDGRWIAYQSNESGKDEIYVQAVEQGSRSRSSATSGAPSGKWLVSERGGTTPLWRADGSELFFLDPAGEAMAVAVKTSATFEAGIPRVLFKVPRGLLFWDVTPDGQRFLFAVPDGASKQMLIQIVVNWEETLR